MRSLGWDGLKASTWSQPAHACPPVSTYQHKAPQALGPWVTGLLDLDGSPEVGVRAPESCSQGTKEATGHLGWAGAGLPELQALMLNQGVSRHPLSQAPRSAYTGTALHRWDVS